MSYGECIQCRSHEAARQRASARGYLGDEKKDVGMWVAHIDETLHTEVALLQLGLLIDHDRFLPHDLAAQALESDRVEGRRTWIKTLKVRLHEAATILTSDLPTLYEPALSRATLQSHHASPDADRSAVISNLSLDRSTPAPEPRRSSLDSGPDSSVLAPQTAAEASLAPPYTYDPWGSSGNIPTGTFGQRHVDRSRELPCSRSMRARLRNDIKGIRVPVLPDSEPDQTSLLDREEHWPYPGLVYPPLDDMHVTWSPALQNVLSALCAPDPPVDPAGEVVVARM
ncbi:hypothetical protein P7C70_g8476, partial [Phenoliferia sp. Uapishka_3]